MSSNYDNEYGTYEDREVTFEILEHIGVLANFPTGWRKEINLVSWNGAAGKYDIREWDPSHERMSRGITLRENEMRVLLDLMRRRRRPAQRIGGGPRRVETQRSSAGAVPPGSAPGPVGAPGEEIPAGYHMLDEDQVQYEVTAPGSHEEVLLDEGMPPGQLEQRAEDSPEEGDAAPF